jgi:hypothetical protein
MSGNITDALKAVIAARDWDFAGELADEHQFVDCLRCFAAPRRVLFDEDTPSVYMCLFCASCWYAHQKHQKQSRRKTLTECEVCNVIGMHRSMEEVLALQHLRAAERRYLSAFGWTKDGDSWNPPPGQRFKYTSGYTHNHAVNALKQRQGESRGPKQPLNPRWTRPSDD